MRFSRALSLAIAATTACAVPTEGPEAEESLGQVSQAVAMERPGKVEYAFRYYADANIARVAFASPKWAGGCSSTMIGPNIVLTAAHCGPAEAAPSQTSGLTFMTYRANETERNTETFQCRRLIHGWPRHDLAVLYCDPNAAGVSPGDKYGYLDFETRAPAVGDSVYSIWWNAVDNGATGSTMVPLYSAGKVTQTNATIWSGILGAPAGTPVGIKMDTWAQPGASGSSNVDANTHRILVGPTTLANQDQPVRWAFSMRTYLDSELLAPGEYTGAGFLENVKESNFPAGSYDFARYVGKVDKSVNGVFDVQEDIERQRGENRRTSYGLGFDSRRRNQLWETGFVAIDPVAKETPIPYVGAGLVLRHRFLNLKPNTSYRVGVKVKTNSAGNGSALSVGFERSNQAAWSVANLATTPGTTVLRTAVIRTDASPNPFFALRTTGAFNGSVSEIQLVEDGATNTFELADDREGWSTVFGPANFLPRGVNGEIGPPNFALAVRALWSTSIPVSTQKMLFVANRAQRLCFSARALASTAASGVARVTTGGSQVLNANFPLSTSWTNHCFGRIYTPSSDTTLTFASNGSISTSYLVDNVRVEVDPNVIFVPPIVIGGVFAP
ncbi:MAG: trypsin-like peptidase domain-containing protein [Labilithrix sp.]|nr:trypsin-like peptidase domain-containing protein [Labilithrix sp.]